MHSVGNGGGIPDVKSDDVAVHKCRLLDAEIPSITYNSGGTYTLGKGPFINYVTLKKKGEL